MGTIRGAASVLVVPIGSMQDYEGSIPGNGILQESGLIWLLLDGATIGNGSSGATRYANAKARDLFTRLWSNTNLGIFTSTGTSSTRGASADADFDANKRLVLPDPRGRVIIPAGQGSGLTTRNRGQAGGEEAHTLTTGETSPHTHYSQFRRSVVESPGFGLTESSLFLNRPIVWTGGGISLSPESESDSTGGGQAHNNMQPYYVSAGKLILAGRV